jgi:MFS superfamily sulfate permease-like transporter
MQALNKQNLINDLVSSVTVLLVALPISLGIAIASGVDPVYGLLTAVIGALIVTPITGSSFQVSGPSAGMAVMVLHVVQTYGIPALVPLAIITGFFQIIIALLKWGHLFQATPPALVKAMLSGIGFLIILSQLYILFDLELSPESYKNILNLPKKILILMKEGISTKLIENTFISGVVILTMALWPRLKTRVIRKMPASLVGIIFAIVFSSIFEMNIQYISLPKNFMSIFEDRNFLYSFRNIDFSFIGYAIGFSFVASVETMLCASAIDQMTNKDSKFNKTILAQGIGNLFAVLIGTIPVVGVVSRSAANVEAGAKTKASSIIQGFWIMLFLLMPAVLEYIPLASLLGLLIFIGYKLLDPLHIFDYVKNYNKTSLIFLTTFVLIISFDLLVGVLAGFFVAIFILLFDVLKYDLIIEESHGNKVIKFSGKLSFLDLPVLNKELSQHTDGLPSNIEVCLREVRYLDPAIEEKLERLKEKLEKEGHSVEIKNK